MTRQPPEPVVQGADVPDLDADATTQDTMFRGRVQLAQHQRGYRFSVDAVLLAHEAAQYQPATALDVGAGCGVVSLLLADLWTRSRDQTPAMWGIECQPALAALAAHNVRANERDEQIQIACADIRQWSWPLTSREKPRLMTCNPPFFRVDAGRSSPNAERDNARRERAGTLEELVKAVADLLHPRGHVVFVYPAAGCQRLMAALLAVRLQTTRLRWVHPYPDADASLILLSARHRASPLVVAAPLFLYEQPEDRQHTATFDAILSGDLPAPL